VTFSQFFGGAARQDLIRRLAAHLRAPLDGETMRCPECGSDAFRASMSLDELQAYDEGYLPGAPFLVGICDDCGHREDPAFDVGNIDRD
jgi:hypothetical protein